jgi:GT2 family glycosyltransferase
MRMVEGTSIVVVCYNAGLHLQGLLNSIDLYLAHDSERLEIIIIDNSDGDYDHHSVKAHEKISTIPITYRRSGGNIGYGAGNNLGISMARYEIVAIVNPDVRFVDNPLPIVRKIMKSSSKTIGVSGKQISRFGVSFFIRPEYQFPILREFTSKLLPRLGLFNHRMMALSGALMFIDKGKFIEIGSYDEKIFMYGEEADISIRAYRNGYLLKYTKKIRYIHLDWNQRNTSSITSLLISSVKNYAKKYDLNCSGYFWATILNLRIKILIARLRGDTAQLGFHQDQLCAVVEKISQ